MASHPDIYISTQTGLYRGAVNATIRDIEELAPSELGTVRAPVVIDYQNPDRLFAVTRRGGVFRSDDGGKTWHVRCGFAYIRSNG